VAGTSFFWGIQPPWRRQFSMKKSGLIIISVDKREVMMFADVEKKIKLKKNLSKKKRGNVFWGWGKKKKEKK